MTQHTLNELTSLYEQVMLQLYTLGELMVMTSHQTFSDQLWHLTKI